MKTRKSTQAQALIISSTLCLALFSSIGLVGCSSKSDVEKAAVIAEQIKKTPKKAEAILEEHDMTIDEFEKVMYDIAADPELSKQYQAALKKTK